MNFKFINRNNPLTYHATIILIASFILVGFGLLFLQISTCHMADYMYSSGRLDGKAKTSLFCRIF